MSRSKHNETRFLPIEPVWRLAILIILPIFYQTPAQTLRFSDTKGIQDREFSKKISHYESLGYTRLLRSASDQVVQAGKYVAIDDFAISRGQTVSIEAGAEFFFEAGKKIFVDGKLLAKGTSLKPVLFTNIPFSQSYIPVIASDSLWGGLEAGEQGIIEFTHTSIRNAKKGLDIVKSDSLHLNCVDIKNTSGARLSIGSYLTILTDTNCLYFPNLATVSPQMAINSRLKASTIWGISSGILLCGTAVAGILTKVYYDKARNGLEPEQVNSDGDAARSFFLTTQVLGGTAAVAVTGFTISLAINKKKARNQR